MRVYVAGPWRRRTEVAQAAEQIHAAGHIITHPWWEHEDVPLDWGLHEKYRRELATQARKDFQAVEGAEVVVVMNLEQSEGKAVEQGIALALEIPIIVVGAPVLNIFQYLFVQVDTLEDALARMAGGMVR